LALADPTLASAVAEDAVRSFVVGGRVLDGGGEPVPDALVETWQVDGHFARCPTDADGRWTIRTVKPPAVATRDGTPQSPHLVVSVFARGLLDRVVTRLYFGDEDAANATDPTLAAVAPARRRLLIGEGDEHQGYRLDIRLQGDDESVFFAV
jgi:protocatechuate 3,4-dioxygenase alpha subunit